MDILNKLQEIEIKLKAIQQKSLFLETENSQLKAKLKQLNEDLLSKDEQIINLEEQNKMTKLAGGLSSNVNNGELKSQLDHLIEEIDHCIKLVKR